MKNRALFIPYLYLKIHRELGLSFTWLTLTRDLRAVRPARSDIEQKCASSKLLNFC